MEITKYALLYNNYIICHDIYNMLEIHYDYDIKESAEFYLDIDPIYRIVRFYFNPDLPFPENEFVFKISEVPFLIEEGLYELYPIKYLNNNPFIISKEAHDNFVNILYVSESVVFENTVKRVINKRIDSTIGDNSIYILLKGGYIPLMNEETGKTEASLSQKELITFLRQTGIIYPIQKNIDTANFYSLRFNYGSDRIVSEDRLPLAKNEEDIYLDGVHYVSQVVNTLRNAYPSINVFSTPNDWKKKEGWKSTLQNNESGNKEWLRFTAGAEDFSQARREFFPNFGPVILGVRLPVEFEYATTDTVLFKQRRADLFLDEFITFYANDHVKLEEDYIGDNSKIIGFSIVWRKDDMLVMNDVFQRRSSQIAETADLSIHSMRFTCDLHITIIRRLYKSKPIFKIICDLIADDPSAIKEQDRQVVVEATEKQKKYVYDKLAKGETVHYGEVNNMDKIDSVESTIPKHEEGNVEIVAKKPRKRKNNK